MERFVLAIKRLLRPLIPDALMARYRLHQHSRQVRHNVDVLVSTPAERRRWLRVTPDTYRIGLAGDRAVPDPAARSAGGTAAVVTAVVESPRLLGRRRAEPRMRATGVNAAPWATAEVGDHPDPVVLHLRLGDAGHRVVLLPTPAAVVDPSRHDPIDRPVWVVLAAVPISDVGGGSRGAQIAIELLRRGFHVVYVALFGSHESVDLGLRFVHPRLEQYRFDQFDTAALISRATAGGVVIAELPAPVIEEPLTALGAAGWSRVYDIVDLWSDPALGGDWYRPEAESRHLAQADLVTASAPDLVELADRWRRTAILVPNAVDPARFPGEPGPVPSDLPEGSGPVFTYHGSLYGDWFDWEALARVGAAYPAARVIVIGDRPKTTPVLPGNVHLLGLKPQGHLGRYLAHTDVGLLPFRVTTTTHAVSPLKVFEYLACGVPVAAPPLRSLEGLEGVAVDPDLVEAVAVARRLPRPDPARAAREHSWQERVGRITAAMRVPDPGDGWAPEAVLRPVIHYPRRARRL